MTPTHLWSARQRILSGVVVTDGACWEWQRATSLGYGRIKAAGKLDLAHRVAYRIFVGPIPDGHELDHLCRNRVCCNPDHLEPVTHSENMRRAFADQTECRHGHPVDGHYADGRRRCMTCKRDQQRAWIARRAAA